MNKGRTIQDNEMLNAKYYGANFQAGKVVKIVKGGIE